MSYSYQKIKGKIEPMPDDILVYDMESGEKKIGGIIIIDDTALKAGERGIRPRWCTVYKVGNAVDYVKPGQQILVAHGRWTFAIDYEDENGKSMMLQKVDTKEILLVQD